MEEPAICCRFKVAELCGETLAKRVFADRRVELHLKKQLSVVDAAAAKKLFSELQCKVAQDRLDPTYR
ncbi:MAG: hypothetical protein ACT4QA_17195 [Panacagrimonas sp.]